MVNLPSGAGPAGTCWLHPALVVAPSPLHGVGLFARQDLPAGEVLSRLGGGLVTKSTLALLIGAAERGEQPYVDTITVGAGQHLVLPHGTANGRGNHSCDPNAWWVDAYTLAARRAIKAAEEITNDYATSTSEAAFRMQCSCTSPLCRGVVTGSDWRRPELQERYGRHWVPALLQLIDAGTASHVNSRCACGEPAPQLEADEDSIG